MYAIRSYYEDKDGDERVQLFCVDLASPSTLNVITSYSIHYTKLYEDGSPLEYRLYTTDDAKEARILEIISDGFMQIGISAPPTLMDEDSLIALYPDFDFDLIYWGWGLDPDPDFAMLIFTCDQREEGGWSDSGYCDEDFEQMYVDQGVAFDHETRRALIWEMQEKLFNERPYIVLTYAKNIQAYRSDRFTGFGEKAGDILWKSALLQARPVQ